MILGSNLLIIAEECFCSFTHIQIGQVHPTRGFSAFQFIPGLSIILLKRSLGTNDTAIVAIKTEEVRSLPLATYIMVFYINGTIVVPEIKVPGNFKFEGVEFFSW